jgi:hypothetical protein
VCVCVFPVPAAAAVTCQSIGRSSSLAAALLTVDPVFTFHPPRGLQTLLAGAPVFQADVVEVWTVGAPPPPPPPPMPDYPSGYGGGTPAGYGSEYPSYYR